MESDPPLDLEQILLEPFEEEAEAVCNPAVFQDYSEGPWPFVYRCIKTSGVSVINLRKLLNPIQLSEDYKTIIEPTENYELYGCEDPGLVKINETWHIPYVGWDRKSARICLATTANFENIKKWGVIGPQISLEEGLELVPEMYKKVLKKYLKEAKNLGLNLKEFFVWDKDPVIEYNPLIKKWILIHRIDPHAHKAIVDSLDELTGEKGKEYWREHFKNLDKHVFLVNNESWEREKVGFACFVQLGDKKVGIFHGVSKRLNYCVGACEVDPESYIILSKMRTPLLRSNRRIYIFKYEEGGKEKTKRVIFPKGTIVNEKTRRLYIYCGLADRRIGVRSVNIDWLYRELNHQHNRLKCEPVLSS